MSDYIESPPAFPQQCADALDVGMVHEGMSLRDWFAGHAIGAIIGAVSAGQHRTYEANTGSDLPAIMADDAYEIADAMLVARSAS